MRVLPPLLACLLCASACSGGSREDPDDRPGAQATATDVAAMAAVRGEGPLPVARSEKVSNDLYEFEYAYPAAAAAVPDLRAWLDADIETQRRALIEQAQEALAESRKSDFPYNPYGYWTEWKVVADLPGWLSLSASVSTYEGGAHPNHGFTALVWDRQANLRREALDFFASKEALSRAIRPQFCREIDRQRAKKRGEPVRQGGDDPFTDCIDPVANTVILGSSNGKAFDRVGILVAPYEAGPYVEGSYEVTLPVTDAVMAAVKPDFRAAFVKGR